MTREEAKELLPIIKAFAEGKEIQYRNSFNEWIDIKKNEGLSFIKTPLDYRIKPESKYRPFKSQEECWDEMHKHPDLGWVMTKSKDYLNITEIFLDGINFPLYYIGEGHCMSEDYNYNKSFSHFTFTDGTPFGIKE